MLDLVQHLVQNAVGGFKILNILSIVSASTNQAAVKKRLHQNLS